jgi:hypothetical protein
MANIKSYTDNYGPAVLRKPNNETKWAYRGSVSKPLSPTRFNINKSGLSATVKKGHSRGV